MILKPITGKIIAADDVFVRVKLKSGPVMSWLNKKGLKYGDIVYVLYDYTAMEIKDILSMADVADLDVLPQEEEQHFLDSIGNMEFL